MNYTVVKKTRLSGIDLFKGIAAYAVVFIHSLDRNFAATGYLGEKLGLFFSEFAVPFFLATSFYLMIKKIYLSDIPYSFRARYKGLLVPYLTWSLIYLTFRVLKYAILGEFTKIYYLFSDPVSIIFLGGTAVHLYFLPLLISGIFYTHVTISLVSKNRDNMKLIILLLILSVVLYELVLVSSGNSFHLGPNVAFENLLRLTIPDLNNNPIIRLILVQVSWMLRCLPYIFTAILLNHPYFRASFSSFNILHTILFFISFLILDSLVTFNLLTIPGSISELNIAYLSLLSSISLSNQMRENYIITNLGFCSFGIYLIHHLIVEFIQLITHNFFCYIFMPVVTILICATASFLLSWASVAYLRKFKKLKNLFLN